MVYPSAVIVIFIGVIVILLGWVIPAFENMFKDFGAEDELPGLTQIVIAISEAFVGYLPLIILGVIGVVVGDHLHLPTPKRQAASSTR